MKLLELENFTEESLSHEVGVLFSLTNLYIILRTCWTPLQSQSAGFTAATYPPVSLSEKVVFWHCDNR